MEKEMDLYTDYLLSSFEQVTVTCLSNLLDGSISHDRIIRLLSNKAYASKKLWQEVKSVICDHESEDVCLIFYDDIVSKPYTDENDFICWHWYHSKNRNEKGINLLKAFYHTQSSTESEALRIPVACALKNSSFH